MKHVILTIVLLLASGLVIAQTKMSDQLSKTTKMNAQSKIYFAGIRTKPYRNTGNIVIPISTRM